MTLYTYYLCHALLFQCIFAGEYSRLSSLLTIRRCPPPGANQSRLRKQRDSKSPTRFSPRWVVPYIGYIGMCRAKGYAFLAVLVDLK